MDISHRWHLMLKWTTIVRIRCRPFAAIQPVIFDHSVRTGSYPVRCRPQPVIQLDDSRQLLTLHAERVGKHFYNVPQLDRFLQTGAPFEPLRLIVARDEQGRHIVTHEVAAGANSQHS